MDRQSFEPTPLTEVDSQVTAGQWTLVFVRELRHPPAKVWAALTEPSQLSEWAPFTTDRDLGTVGDATLTMIDGETKEDLGASVRRAEPPTVLEYTWGKDLLRWELEPTATGTRLSLRHTVEDRSWLPRVAAGWHLCLDVAEHLLDGHPVGPIRGAEAMNFGWNDLRSGYEQRLGRPDAD